jgi:hypothetical protein
MLNPQGNKTYDPSDRLAAEKSVLTREYAALIEEVRDVETIRKYAEEVQRAITPTTRTHRREVEI